MHLKPIADYMLAISAFFLAILSLRATSLPRSILIYYKTLGAPAMAILVFFCVRIDHVP